MNLNIIILHNLPHFPVRCPFDSCNKLPEDPVIEQGNMAMQQALHNAFHDLLQFGDHVPELPHTSHALVLFGISDDSVR
jgi:hypothetical protein